MNMPGIGGLEATKKIIRYSPDIKVIVLTVYSEDPIPTKVMQIGAAGYLTKGCFGRAQWRSAQVVCVLYRDPLVLVHTQ